MSVILEYLPYALFLTFLILATGLTFISVRFAHNLTARILIVMIYLVFIPTLYIGVSELLGRDKPASMEILNKGEAQAQMLWHGANPQKTKIFLLLKLESVTDPRLYSIPYDEETKKELQSKQRKGQQANQPVVIENPFSENFLIKGPRMVRPDPSEIPPKGNERGETQYFNMDPDPGGQRF